MKAHGLCGVLMAFGLVAAPAMAAFTPEEPWDSSVPTNENNLYEVYNDLYGTSFGSNADLDPFLVNENGLLSLSSIAGAQSVTVTPTGPDRISRCTGSSRSGGDGAPAAIGDRALVAAPVLVVGANRWGGSRERRRRRGRRRCGAAPC